MIDNFLVPNSAFKRLWQEYHDYDQLIIAVDFDDVLYDFHNTGCEFKQMHKLINELHDLGCFIVIWTANQNMDLVKRHLKDNKIPYDLINEDARESLGFWADKGMLPGRKIYANYYVDDRGGLLQSYSELELLVHLLKWKK